MKAKDFRLQAWGKLSGKWGTMALVMLVYALIMLACDGLAFVGIGAIALIIISGPLTLGFTILAMDVIADRPVSVEKLFDGFKDLTRSLVLYLIETILIALWALLFIVPGIIKCYSYSMSFYILRDDPAISANEARKRSMELMVGHKWRLFCLDVSFIGWYLLSILTLGILLLWIEPYHQTARAAFYQDLMAQVGASTNTPAPTEELPSPEEPAEEDDSDKVNPYNE